MSRTELFQEIYGCYYQVVRQILSEAAERPATAEKMRELSAKYGFMETSLSIVPKLLDGSWPLLTEDRLAVLKNPEVLAPGAMPLTLLQRSWLKAILQDERARLFFTDTEYEELLLWLSDTEPLFDTGDFHCFDRYRDGDAYDSPDYRNHFHTILEALQKKKALFIAYENRHGLCDTKEAAPFQLQYSSKDDKFRLCCLERSGRSFSRNTILNLGRIRACHLSREDAPPDLMRHAFRPARRAKEPVVIEIGGERNSLERCMLRFANYEKHTRFQEETGTWICSIYYDLADETELLIDILSFGPVIRVLGPEPFLNQIRARAARQHRLFYDAI